MLQPSDIHQSNLKICSRCIYDERVASISFDDMGVCNYCKQINDLVDDYGTGQPEGENRLNKIIDQIKLSGKGKKYLHDGAGPLRPSPRATRGREALRGESLASGIYRADVAGWAKGGGRTFRGGGERSSAFPVRRAGCDWRQPSCARSGAHRATPRLRAFQRPRRRGRPRRGRGRASERVSKRHRHEIAPANRAGRAMIALTGLVQCLVKKENFPQFVFACSSGKPGRSNLPKRGGKPRGFFVRAFA